MKKYLIMYNDDSGRYYEGDRPSLRFKFVDKPYGKVATKYDTFYVETCLDMDSREEVNTDYNLICKL